MAACSLRAAPPSSAWRNVWSDEFNGTQLDSRQWASGALPWGGRHHNDEYASYIMPEDAYLDDGSLWLRCRRAAGDEFGGYPYSEGFVHTDGKLNYTYGYAEIRARFPIGRGVWPAFWSLSWGWPPEFDIAEYFGSDNRMHLGLAYGSSWQDVRWDSSSFYQDFVSWRTYGLEWGPDYAVWTVDGVPFKSIYADIVPSTPMYLMLNSGMRWDADGSTPFPNHFEVDYCRLFDLPLESINDNTTGRGLHRFLYRGDWGYAASQGGAFLNDNHWSGQVDDSFQVMFLGNRVDLYGAVAPNHGIAAISVDDQPEQLVDYYAPQRTDKALIWSSTGLAPGKHFLRVRVTGTKHPDSGGHAVTVDRLDVWNSLSPLAGTIIGTERPGEGTGDERYRAFDGNLHSFFDVPVSANAWLGLDFGEQQQRVLTKVRFCPRPDHAQRMLGGRFQGANRPDFSDAVELGTITALPVEGTLSEIPIHVAESFRYVRYISSRASYGNVAELEFHGGARSVSGGYRVNAGGGWSGGFSEDAFVAGGSASFTWGSIDRGDLTEPAPEEVYQSAREGDLTYTFPYLPPGEGYRVRLHFCETVLSEQGQRLFDVAVNGLRVVRSLDVLSEAGGMHRAMVREFVVAADQEGVIRLQLDGVVAEPVISGIEVEPVPRMEVERGAGAGGGVGVMIVSWPAWATGYSLRHVPDLEHPIVWTVWPEPPEEVEGRFQVEISIGVNDGGYFQLSDAMADVAVD